MRTSNYYPPGAEFDPRAPYNQAGEGIDVEAVEAALALVGDLEEVCGQEDALNPLLKDVRRIFDFLDDLRTELRDFD